MEEKAASESPKEVPWLVFPYGEGKKNHSFHNIFEPNHTTCRKFMPELSRKRFWQKHSHQGWLIVLCDVKDDDAYIDDVDLSSKFRYWNFLDSLNFVTSKLFSLLFDCDLSGDFDLSRNSEKYIKPVHKWKYGDCFLWHPVTLETIQLPSLLNWISKPDDYHLIDCVLSSPPRILHDSDGEYPIVLFIFRQGDTQKDHAFLFCHPGDKNWRTQLYSQDTTFEVQSLHCFKGKLYVIGMNEQQLEIEQQQLLGANDNNVMLSVKPFKVNYCGSFSFRGAREYSWGLIHCVECDDELFNIHMFIYERGSEKVVISIRITRLDFSSMRWKVVNTLGDHVLFIGQNTAVCCSAAELGLARGCLYYTLPEDPRLYKFEVESAGDSVILSCLELPMPWHSPDWIMMPGGLRRKEVELGADEKDQGYVIKTWEKKINISYCIETQYEHALQYEKQSGRKLEERNPWNILNEDMVKLIADYLHPLDYVHFRAVCKANREIMPVAKPTLTSETRIIEATYLSPWLLFSRDNNFTIYNLINPVHNNENYLMKFPELLLGATIRYQKGGWLLLSREEELFFYNPFTREIINLPDFPGRHHMSDISFSSLPTSSDCIIFAIERGYDGISILCIRRGAQECDEFEFDTDSIEKYPALLNTPLLFNGVFYSVGYDGTLGQFNLEDGSWKPLEKPGKQFNDSFPSYLVQCGGDLLLLKLGYLEMPVRIFRLDFCDMEWVKVESLGRYMLFVSDITCLSAVAPNSRMENKVYFPRLCLNGEGILFYSLETGSYQSFGTGHFAKNFCGTEGWHGNCAWIEPNWTKSTPQELDWFNSLSVA